MTLATLLAAIAAALFIGAWFLTRWGAHSMLLAGGFKRPQVNLPEHFQLPYEKVRFKSTDGVELSGWFMPAKTPSEATIVLCHGWGTNKGDILPATSFLAERYNLLYFDFRYCGESGGEMSSVGYLESRDVDGALAFLKKEKPAQSKRIGVYGLSMGASTAFMGVARNPEIRAAVIVNPFPSFTEVTAQYAWHKYKVPYYPLIAMVMWHTHRKLGVDPEMWSARYHAPKIRKSAVFLIHGEHDPLAAPAESRRLHDLVKGPKELWIVPGAGHEDIHEVAKEEYLRRVSKFYETYL